MRPKLPEITRIGARLATLDFTTPLDQEESRICKASYLRRAKGLVILSTNWIPSICISGLQINLASISSKEKNAPERAARFADMARMFFWKYRLRKCRPPQAGELNITVARATADLKNEIEIVKILAEQEKVLLTKGIIKAPAEGEPLPKEKRTTSKHLLAISDMSTRVVNLQSRFTQVETFLGAQTAEIKDLRAEGIARGARLDGQLSMLVELSKRLDAVQAYQITLNAVLEKIADKLATHGSVTSFNPGYVMPQTTCSAEEKSVAPIGTTVIALDSLKLNT